MPACNFIRYCAFVTYASPPLKRSLIIEGSIALTVPRRRSVFPSIRARSSAVASGPIIPFTFSMTGAISGTELKARRRCVMIFPSVPAMIFSMMQAFASFHLVPAERLWLGFARGKLAPRALTWTSGGTGAGGEAIGAAASGGSIPGGSTSAGRLLIPEGGKAELRLSIKPGLDAAPESLTISLVDPPAGIGLDGWSAVPGGLVLRFSASAGTAGIHGALILKAGIKPETPGAKARDLGYLPALAIEVVRP